MDGVQMMPVPVQASNTDGFGGGGIIGGLLLGSLLGGRGLGGGLFGNGFGGGPATAAVATDIVLNPAFQSLQGQITNLANSIGDNAIQDQINHLGDQQSAQSTAIQAALGNLSTAQAAGNFTTLQSINGLGASVTAQANQNALQQLNSFNQLTTTTLTGFNSQAMQTQNATNQIIAQGTANAAAMAACCCELKEAISRDGDETRALINENRMNDLQSALNEARLAASQAAQTNSLLAALGKVPVV